MKIVIVGGVAGGATAAARMRRNSEDAEIILIERGDYISYANCGLPYYLGGVIQDRDNLFVQTPQSFGKRFNVDVRVKEEVTAIDAEKKNVTIRTRDGKEYTESFDKLLLSPGAAPVRPPLPGIDTKGIFTLRNVNDTDAIKNYIDTHHVRSAVVVGAGFIGLEMSENLVHRGINVSIVEMGDQVMAPLDYSMAAIVHQELTNNGVNLYLKEAVESFAAVASTDNGASASSANASVNASKRISVNLKSGTKIEADLVILSIGVRTETSLAVNAGIKLGEAKGIFVDEYLETSKKDIYAVGDAIEFPHPVSKKPWLNLLAGPANRQARIVADNIIFGNKLKYDGSIGTAIAKVFDLTVASTGLPAKRLKQLGMDYVSSFTHSQAHASYYPGGGMLDIKITFNKQDGKLLGAQIVGPEGVDKRIDEFAAVIKRGGTIYDLIETEHAYAPPFSSAKDPVAIAGYVASNIVEDKVDTFTWRELPELTKDADKAVLIDVRTKDEFDTGHIANAINVPVDDIRDRLNDIPKDKEILIYCGVGLRGYIASRILQGHGYNKIKNLSGGIRTYNVANAKVKPPVPFNDKDQGPSAPTVGSNSSGSSGSGSSGSCSSGSCSSGSTKSCCGASYHQSCSAQAAVNSNNMRNSSNANDVGSVANKVVKTIDARGLQCPGPILKLKQGIEAINQGEAVKVIAKELSFTRDAEAWCKTTGNTFGSFTKDDGYYEVYVMKGGAVSSTNILSQEAAANMSACSLMAATNGITMQQSNKGKTFIMFSDDLDKALATFVLANGAAATGEKVTIFFTFWGLNVIKKTKKPNVAKDFFGRMFSMMLPGSSEGLKLSKLNMFGAGSRMMRYIMAKKGIASLESLRDEALKSGVEFIACDMSMDVMGVSKEELLEEVTYGGVATYMERANNAGLNLFI